MRYGNPSTASRLEALQAAGCQKILLAPLYPQYSATTTATANDKAFDALKTMRWQPAMRTLPAYFDEPAYIAALAQSIADGVAALRFRARPGPHLVSRHAGGLSASAATPTTASASRRRGWCASSWAGREEKLMVTFQSRFGPTEWLKPYTDDDARGAAGAGRRRRSPSSRRPSRPIASRRWRRSPSPAASSSSTPAASSYAYIPCLNDSEAGMEMLESVVRKELQGWV